MLIVVLLIVLFGILLGKLSGNVTKYSENEDYITKVWCEDTDGMDITKAGTVVHAIVSGKVITVNDECGGVSDARFDQPYVYEAYCENSKYHREAIYCPEGTNCIEGACV